MWQAGQIRWVLADLQRQRAPVDAPSRPDGFLLAAAKGGAVVVTTLADRLSNRLDTVEALARAVPFPELWSGSFSDAIPADAAFMAVMSPDRVLALIARDRQTIVTHRGHKDCPNLRDAAAAWGVD